MADFKLPTARFASLPLPLMDSNPSGPSRRLGLKLECWKFALPPEVLGGIWASSLLIRHLLIIPGLKPSSS